MQYLGARLEVVSENIANADTPGFKAREVSSFAEMVEGGTRSGLHTTDTRHIDSSWSSGDLRATEDDTAWETSIDGNSVVLEQQAIKAGEIGESYQLAAQLYRKGHDLLALSITGLR